MAICEKPPCKRCCIWSRGRLLLFWISILSFCGILLCFLLFQISSFQTAYISHVSSLWRTLTTKSPKYLEQMHMSRCTTKPMKWCAPSEDSDQPEHLPSLMREFAVPFGKLRTQCFFMRTGKTDQTGQMPRLIWVCWAHRSFCWFCCAQAHIEV